MTERKKKRESASDLLGVTVDEVEEGKLKEKEVNALGVLCDPLPHLQRLFGHCQKPAPAPHLAYAGGCAA